MVTPDRTAGEVDVLTAEDRRAILDHHSQVLHARSTQVKDDIIRSLSDAYENKRARQVGEWESRQNVRRAAR
jgi:hypothetical protein